jgi:predicted DCC family thiol-disulfide oxidoreductase YuxK
VSEIIVIFDGQCELCRNSISWVQKKLVITPLDFHTADLSIFGLSKTQCAQEVFSISGQSQYRGAAAVAYLLMRRGNKILSGLITASGPIGRAAYKWVASNRNSFPVKVLSYLLKGSSI